MTFEMEPSINRPGQMVAKNVQGGTGQPVNSGNYGAVRASDSELSSPYGQNGMGMGLQQMGDLTAMGMNPQMGCGGCGMNGCGYDLSGLGCPGGCLSQAMIGQPQQTQDLLGGYGAYGMSQMMGQQDAYGMAQTMQPMMGQPQQTQDGLGGCGACGMFEGMMGQQDAYGGCSACGLSQPGMPQAMPPMMGQPSLDLGAPPVMGQSELGMPPLAVPPEISPA